jgi:hypothetical protein
VRINRKTITVLGTLTIVGLLCVAAASVALARADGGEADTAGYVDLAAGSHVVWGAVADGAHRVTPSIATTVTAVSPTVKAVGSSAFTMTVFGQNFSPGATVALPSGSVTPTPGFGPTSLTASVPAGLLTIPGAGFVKVFNPGSTASTDCTSTATFTVTQPTVTSVSPTSAAFAGPPVELTITGTNLQDGLAGPTLLLRGTGSISSTTLVGLLVAQTSNTSMKATFNLTAPTAAPIGAYDVILTYGASGLVVKLAAFTITNPLPTVTTINPTTVYAKSMQPLQLTVNGTGFVPGASGSAVKIGARLTTNTTFVSSTQLTVPLTAADIAAAATVPITVVNPAPGGGTSNAVNLTVASDVTPPVTTITGADDAWHNTPVVLTVTASDAQSGVMKTEYSIDGAAPITLTETTVTVPADGTAEGENVVKAWSTDWSGNVESPGPSVTVKIDTVKPTASGKDVSGKVNKSISLQYKFTDNVSPKIQAVYIKITKSNGKVVKNATISGTKNPKTWYSFSWKPSATGKYYYYVHGEDLAGNTSTTHAPTITVK